MPFINMKTSEDFKEKLEWLAEVMDESQTAIIRNAVLKVYDEQKALHQNDVDFLRWIRANKQGK
jgi:predicted transcriptional regulator